MGKGVEKCVVFVERLSFLGESFIGSSTCIPPWRLYLLDIFAEAIFQFADASVDVSEAVGEAEFVIELAPLSGVLSQQVIVSVVTGTGGSASCKPQD